MFLACRRHRPSLPIWPLDAPASRASRSTGKCACGPAASWVSDDSAGRAVGIGAVDGEVCRGTRTGRCAEFVHELAAVTGSLRPTELIYCWDPDGPSDPGGFDRADHCDHTHVGWDA